MNNSELVDFSNMIRTLSEVFGQFEREQAPRPEKKPAIQKPFSGRKMKVYRVCAQDGGGLYQSDLYYHSVTSSDGNWPSTATSVKNHPNAIHDAKLCPQWESLDDTSPFYFAFSGRTQLNRWICRAKWRKKMSELGGKVEVYEVPIESVLRGSCQVVFKMQDAVKIAELTVDTFEALA